MLAKRLFKHQYTNIDQRKNIEDDQLDSSASEWTSESILEVFAESAVVGRRISAPKSTE